VDDIKGKKGGSGSRGNGLADDLDNGKVSTTCISASPTAGFVAVVSDVPTSTLGVEFSSGKEVLVAGLPVDALALAKTCSYKVNGKTVDHQTKLETIKKGGSFIIEDLDKVKVLGIRRDIATGSFANAKSVVSRSLGADISKLNWDLPVGQKMVIDDVIFTRAKEKNLAGKSYPDPEHFTFEFKTKSGMKGRVSWHRNGHAEYANDFNGRQPHFNVDIDKNNITNQVGINSHITYPRN
jgi:hypothetical protein